MDLPFEVILGGWVATGLTLFILSFLYEDNPLFKLAETSLRRRLARVYDRQNL